MPYLSLIFNCNLLCISIPTEFQVYNSHDFYITKSYENSHYYHWSKMPAWVLTGFEDYFKRIQPFVQTQIIELPMAKRGKMILKQIS